MANEADTQKAISLRFIERALLFVGCLLLAIVTAVHVDRAFWLHTEISRFRAAQRLDAAYRKHDDGVDFEIWHEAQERTHQNQLAQPVMPILGILRIPSAHLEVPVLEGTNKLSLNRGVGHILGTPRPGQNGNIGIAGHRDGFFRGLRSVNVGDFIELESLGRILTYRVNQLQIVDSGDVAILNSKEVPSLTLVTCYPFNFIGSAPRRYVVEAALTAVGTGDVSTGLEPQVTSLQKLQLQ